MAKFERSIRSGDVDTSQRGGVVPNGVYRLEVTETDIKKSKSGRGKVFSATILILEPEQFKGRKIFLNENIEHENPQVEEIGNQGVAKLSRAVGIPQDQELDDTEDLHGYAFMADVGLERLKEGDTSPPKNKIWRYYYPEEDQPEPHIQESRAAPSRPARGRREEEPRREREPSRERDRDDSRSRGRDEGRSDRQRDDDSRSRGRDEGRSRDDGGRSSRDDSRDRDNRDSRDDRREDANDADIPFKDEPAKAGAGGKPWKKRS